MEQWRSAVLLAVVILGCKESAPESGGGSARSETGSFLCYRTPQNGNSERECSRSPSRCDEVGCIKQERAFCFFDQGHMGIRGDPNPQWICLSTQEECASWRASVIQKRDAGPCLSMKVDDLPKE